METRNTGLKRDYAPLSRTLDLARSAYQKGYSPVGCVITNERGEVIYEAESRRLIGDILHAETIALLELQRDQKPDWGAELSLYCTLEPCLMCMGMALISRVSRIVWAMGDYWGGASHIYDFSNEYLQSRRCVLVPTPYPDLEAQSREMWIPYLASTGHAHMTGAVLYGDYEAIHTHGG